LKPVYFQVTLLTLFFAGPVVERLQAFEVTWTDTQGGTGTHIVFQDDIDSAAGSGSFSGATVGSWGGVKSVYTDDDLSGVGGPSGPLSGSTYIERIRPGGSAPAGGFNFDGNAESRAIRVAVGGSGVVDYDGHSTAEPLLV